MLVRLFASIGALYMLFWLSTTAALRRTSTPHIFAHSKENPTGSYYFPFPTEKCPDECMYIPQCATNRTRPSRTMVEITNRVKVIQSCFATGTGNCECLFELDPEQCPLATHGQCLMICGGLRCSTPEHNGWDVHTPFPSDRFERIVEAYRKANDTSLDLTRFHHVQ